MMGPHNTSVELMDKARNACVVTIANVKPFRGDKALHQKYEAHPLKAPLIITAGTRDADSNNLGESTLQLSSAM